MTQGELADQRLRQLLELGRSLVSELDLDAVLTRIAEAAADLTDARYAALGVLDRAGTELERFITVGISEEERRGIGDLPRGRGVLGILIRDPRPLRLDEVGAHRESFGFGIGHPPMKSFLGVPIRMGGGDVFGNLYLTEKQGASAFDQDDEDLLVALSDWAAVAIANARRFGGESGRRNELEKTVLAFETTTEIAGALAGETELSRIVELIVKRSRALVDARATVLALLDGRDLIVHATAGDERFALDGVRVPSAGSIAGEVLRSGRSRRFGDLPSTATLGAGIAVQTAVIAPLRFRGRDLGVLAAFDRVGSEPFGLDDERLLAAFALSAAPAVATAQDVAGEHLKRSIQTAERERTRWARELHDETLQDLAAVKTLLAAARNSGEAQKLETAVDQAMEHLQLSITGLRGLITDLRPATLDELGAAAAIRALVTRLPQVSDLEVHLEIDEAFESGHSAVRHEPELEATVYRIVQEAITNVIKHAHATSVAVSLRKHADRLEVIIADDGRGFDPEASSTGFGLTGMRERAGLSGGSLRLEPGADGAGTVVRLELPVAPRPQEEPGRMASAQRAG
jgi:signal transduction histidine kinase